MNDATIPTWFTPAYGIAVIAGALGSILLLVRNSLAVPVVGLSLSAKGRGWLT